MMREWKQWPHNLELFTAFGKVYLTVTERHHIVVNSKDCNLIVRNKPYTAYFHLFDYGEGFELCRNDQPQIQRCGSRTKAGEVATRTILEVVTAKVNWWVKQHPEVLQEAQECYVNNQILSLEQEIKDWLAKVEAHRQTITELLATLKKEDGEKLADKKCRACGERYDTPHQPNCSLRNNPATSRGEPRVLVKKEDL